VPSCVRSKDGLRGEEGLNDIERNFPLVTGVILVFVVLAAIFMFAFGDSLASGGSLRVALRGTSLYWVIGLGVCASACGVVNDYQ
jgi:hypothetical protein